MKKWCLKIRLGIWLAATCFFLSGCAGAEAVRQTFDQVGELWEAEVSEAARAQEDRFEEATGQSKQGETQSTPEEQGPPGQGTDSSQQQNTIDSDQTQEEYSFEETQGDKFAYQSLNETEQTWYRNINRIISQMQEKQELAKAGIEGGLDEKDIDKIFQCVLNDHPEYFYVEGYTYTKFTRMDKLVKIEFSGTYSMDRETAVQRQQEIHQAVEPLLIGIDENAGDYEKVKYVYETIIRNTDYNLNAPDNQNIYSVFVNRASVCQGYAKAAQYLLNRLGMECTIVIGTVDTGEGHSWNLVKADGNYYYVDATWGDASYQIEENTLEEQVPSLPEINYDYLCVTTQQLLRTHTLGGVVPMPNCDSMEDNYYVREGAYFTSYEENQLAEFFATAKEQGKEDITLKCADISTYRELDQQLIEEQGIFQYLDSPDGTVAYAQNEKQLSMTFWVTNGE